MSKIYEALNRNRSEVPEPLLRAINEESRQLEESALEPPVLAEPELQLFQSSPQDELPLPVAGQEEAEAEPMVSFVPPEEVEPEPLVSFIPREEPPPVSFVRAEPPASDEFNLQNIQVVPLRVRASAPLLPFDAMPSRVSEEYRMIRTKIVQHAKQPRVIVVSSAGPADGKSVTAMNVAGALSLTIDTKVLLVDTDFRRPRIAAELGLDEGPGVTDVLMGHRNLQDVLVRAEQMPNLYILPAGERRSNPTELLDSPAWVRLCGELRQHFRYIVMDSPPIRAVADYDLIQAACDGVLMVIRPDHTNRTACEAALATIPSDRLIGIVLNYVQDWFLGKRDPYEYSYAAVSAKAG